MARLRRGLVDARLADAHDRLDRLWRLAESLHPEKPLARGYAWVERRRGGVVTSAAGARAAGALTLHFADGPVDARVERDAAAPYEEKKPQQPKLL
jgi:exodeoxyribonuclease VII large subunit